MTRQTILTGGIGALIAALLWTVATYVLPLYGPLWLAELTNAPFSGSSASISSNSILVAAVIGFVAATLWSVNRSRKR